MLSSSAFTEILVAIFLETSVTVKIQPEKEILFPISGKVPSCSQNQPLMVSLSSETKLIFNFSLISTKRAFPSSWKSVSDFSMISAACIKSYSSLKVPKISEEMLA